MWLRSQRWHQVEGPGGRGVEGGKAWGGLVGLARIYRTTAWSRRCSVDAGRIKVRTRGPWVLRPEGSVQKHPEAFSGPASWLPVISTPFQVAGCKCDGDTFGHNCERSKNLCEEPCFESVQCIPGKGCEACPPHLTGDGRHCAGELGTGLWQEEALGTVEAWRAWGMRQNISLPFPASV